MKVSRILNILLRFGTMITRFLFIFFLAKYFDAGKVGYYGIFSATVSFGILIMGFEYHTYVTREILSVTAEERGRMIKAHALISGLFYVPLIPALISLSAYSSWPDHLAAWFLPLLFLEQFNQEVFRVMTTFSKQLTASIQLFIRQGSWAIFVILYLMAFGGSANLSLVMASWLVASIIAAVFGILEVRQLDIRGWKKPIDRTWIWRGLVVAIPFFIATLLQRGLFVIDRYWLEALGGVEIAGAYVVFFGIASSLSVLLEAGLFSYAYPEIIILSKSGQHSRAHRRVLVLLYQTSALSACFAVISWVTLPFILFWIGNPIFIQVIDMFPWVMSAMIILVISQVPHLGLYAHGNDRPILGSHLAGMIVFLIVTYSTGGLLGTSGVLLGMNCAFGTILLWKAVAYLLFTRVVMSGPEH